jgi:hypothetical protein
LSCKIKLIYLQSIFEHKLFYLNTIISFSIQVNKKITYSIGVLAIVLIVGLNTRHALNGYGVKDNKLHVEILAQTSTTTGTGAGSGTGTGGASKNCKQSYATIDYTTKCGEYEISKKNGVEYKCIEGSGGCKEGFVGGYIYCGLPSVVTTDKDLKSICSQ